MDAVLWHLQNHGCITSWEAIQKYHITRLSAIIHTLRHEVGMNISSSDKRAENGKNWVEYKLIRESDEGQFNLLGRNDA